ncbi:hypothetical protein C0431_12600 [bacterium]|nr:hypothetical protein [bacterium]
MVAFIRVNNLATLKAGIEASNLLEWMAVHLDVFLEYTVDILLDGVNTIERMLAACFREHYRRIADRFQLLGEVAYVSC